jgi:hypothetical protein
MYILPFLLGCGWNLFWGVPLTASIVLDFMGRKAGGSCQNGGFLEEDGEPYPEPSRQTAIETMGEDFILQIEPKVHTMT